MSAPIIVAGAGAFGTALAIALHNSGKQVTLMGRDIDALARTRRSQKLPGIKLPANLKLTDKLETTQDDLLLLAVPMQVLDGFLSNHRPKARAMIACCKGVDLTRLIGPTGILGAHTDAPTGILTGPSFASDIARGLPTALTLAWPDMESGAEFQQLLSTDRLRLYLTDDRIGAELGGALKNVIALACGIAMGAGLGESARASLMTRGYAEINRLATKLGARPETLAGLSGFGDLALTCTSEQSRNYSCGLALGRAEEPPKATVEGRATALAVAKIAGNHGIEMPITLAVASIISQEISVTQALEDLLSRPLGQE